MIPVKGSSKKVPLFSATTQNPPTIRTLSVPLDFSGGLSGPRDASQSHSHSPASCLSHSCSCWGAGGCANMSPTISATTKLTTVNFFTMLSPCETATTDQAAPAALVAGKCLLTHACQWGSTCLTTAEAWLP